MKMFWDRLRQVLRRLGRAPLFTTLTLLTLAVGIGATTLIFSVVDGVLLKPLPYPQPGRLIGVWESSSAVNIKDLNMCPSFYFTFRKYNKTLEDIGAYTDDSFSVTGTGKPEQEYGLDVTQGTLPILGVKPLLGRLFTQQDDSAGAPQTAILTYSYWQKKFGGARNVIGQSITLDGKPREIIGVLPKNFHFLNRQGVNLYVPMQWDPAKTHLGNFSEEGLARLKPGVTMQQASADLQRLIPVSVHSFPPPPGFSIKMFEQAGFKMNLRPLKQDVVGNIGNVLWVLMGSIVLVLLIACANVANLLLVRVEGRRQELAIRTALGAGWRRVAGDLLFESVTLSVMGSALGLVLAFAGLRVLVALAPTGLPRLHDIGINVSVLLFTLVLALISGVLIGLIPVAKYVRGQVNAELREGGRSQSQGRERHKARNVLVVVQVALALVLLICSGLMIRSFRALEHVNPGFTSPATLQTFHIYIPDAQVPSKQPDKVMRMEQEIQDKLAALPGVESVALTTSIPMGYNQSNDLIFARDRTYGEGQIPPIRRFIYITPGLFQTMGTPLIAGRGFTWDDVYNKLPVAIISENFAKEYWGSVQNALGKQIRATSKDDWRQIVGVAANVYENGVDQTPPTTVYWPMMTANLEGYKVMVHRYVGFVIRTPRAGSAEFMREVKQAVWSVDSNLPLANQHPESFYYTQSMARTSFTLVMLAVSGIMALLLGVIGIYGVISYSVSQRTREIGIRMALGAQRGEIIGLFVRQGMLLAVIGAVCGLAAAFASMRLMASLLFGVGAYDPMTYATITVGVLVIACAACWLPSRRAAKVEPMNALRAE